MATYGKCADGEQCPTDSISEKQHRSLKGAHTQSFYILTAAETSTGVKLLYLDATRSDRDNMRSRTFWLLALVLLVFADHSHGNTWILYHQILS